MLDAAASWAESLGSWVAPRLRQPCLSRPSFGVCEKTTATFGATTATLPARRMVQASPDVLTDLVRGLALRGSTGNRKLHRSSHPDKTPGNTQISIGLSDTEKPMLRRPTIEAFDRHLLGLGLRFEGVVIGGSALGLMGVIQRPTRDFDILVPELPPAIA